jgi:hypothetical protein
VSGDEGRHNHCAVTFFSKRHGKGRPEIDPRVRRPAARKRVLEVMAKPQAENLFFGSGFFIWPGMPDSSVPTGSEYENAD